MLGKTSDNIFNRSNKFVILIFTISLDVTGSTPAPPDAKQTPVLRSLGAMKTLREAGKVFLIPKPSAATTQKK